MKAQSVRWTIMLAICTALVSGCLGMVGGPRPGVVTGSVKIVTPSVETESVSSLSFSSTLNRVSLLRNTSPPVSTLAVTGPAEPTYKYLVEFSPELDREQVEALLDRLGLVYLRESAYGFHVVSDPQRRPPNRVVRLLESSPGVLIAEENGLVVPLAAAPAGPWADAWALDAVRAPEAWAKLAEKGSSGEVVIAVIDTGIDFEALDLDGVWITGRDFTEIERVGVAYGPGSSTPAQADSHGTAVVRAIATVLGLEASSVTDRPNVKIMPVRIFPSDRSTIGFDVLADAIEFAVWSGVVDVINLSVGVESQSECTMPNIRRALEHAATNGVIVVAAAGNSGGAVACPAVLPGAIAVGAVDNTLAKAHYSAVGSELDLVAPGVSCIPPNLCQTGTSFAAPRVSGVVALMLSAGFPQDPDKVKALLHMTAIRPDNRPGRDDELGYGRLDALGAVSADIPRILLLEAGLKGRSPGQWTAVRSTEAGVGGHYQITQVPEGEWIVAGWVDVDGDGALSPGDYYAESGPIAVRQGGSILSLDLVLEPYEGDDSAGQ